MTVSDMNALLRRATHRVWHSRFARNVAIVASGTAGAQAITIAFAPIITRLYGPEAFGLLGTFMAILAIAAPIAALTYPIAIVLPKDDRDAMGLVRLSVLLSFGMALLASVLLLMGGDWLTTTLGAESVSGYLLLIPVAMLFGAWLQIVHQWLIRKKQFGVIARSAVAHSLIVNSAKSGIGWFHPIGAVLIVLATLGQAIHAALLFIGTRRRYQAQPIEVAEASRTPLKELASRHRDFPLYRAPQHFINAASQSLPVLMLAAFFGPAAAGFYTLAKLVMGVPSILIGKAVNDVFYPRINEAAHKGENLSHYILHTTGALLAIGIFPFGIVVLIGPWLFSLVFGHEWVLAGEYARWLSLWFLAAFIAQPSIASIPVLLLQRGFLVYEIIAATVRALAIILGVFLFDSDLMVVALLSLSSVFLVVLLLAWLIISARRSDYANQHYH